MNNKIEKYYNQFDSYDEYIENITDLQVQYQKYFQEEEFWLNIDKNDAKQLNDYIQHYPNGRYLLEALQYIENIAWNKANRENTQKSYEEYLTKYPNGRYANEAKAKIDKFIQEEKADNLAWDKAKKENTRNSYKEYLTKYPNGKYANEAKKRLEKEQRKILLLLGIFVFSSIVIYFYITPKTFYDKNTGLMWQDNKDAKTVQKTWSGAKEYCANLRLDGYDDWRLPDYNELLSIVDYTKYNPAIKSGFKNIASNNYWSSSPDVSGSSNAWEVIFNDGYTNYNDKSNKGYVRCVRGRQ